VSRSIQHLEKWLDTRLIFRTTRKIEITESGKRLLNESREILQKIELIQEQLSHDKQLVSGELRVSLPSAFSAKLFSVLPKFTQQYPNLRLRLDYSDDFIDLKGNTFDLAIRAGNMPDSGIFVRKLFTFSEIVIASAEYLHNFGAPKTLEEISKHQCILDTNHSRYDRWGFIDKGVPSWVSINGNIILNQANTVIEACLAGMGLAYLPSFMVEKELQNGQLVHILQDLKSPEYVVNIAFPERDFIPQKTRVFIDFMVAELSSA
jgi:DNA-binding transcriptional LysR family regulator